MLPKMVNKHNTERFRRLHDWYYIYRDRASSEKVEINFVLRQRALKDCLVDAQNGKTLSMLAIKSLHQCLVDASEGYYNKLVIPLDISAGSQGLSELESGMIGIAVSYVSKCKSGDFCRKNHVSFVSKSYGVSRATVQNWMNDAAFTKYKENPYPMFSQDKAENNLLQTGEIYRNNKLARKKA